jgi:hypothetical protein
MLTGWDPEPEPGPFSGGLDVPPYNGSIVVNSPVVGS